MSDWELMPNNLQDKNVSFSEWEKIPIMKDNAEQQNLSKNSFLENAGNIAEKYINKPVEQYVRNPAYSTIAGLEQGIGNILPGTYNLGALGANKLGANLPYSSTLDFAPKNAFSTFGEFLPIIATGGEAALSKLNKLYAVGNNALSKFMPEKFSGQLINELSKGAKTDERNSQSLASDLFNAHQYRKNEALTPIRNLLSKYGENEVYPIVNPTGYHAYRDIPNLELTVGDPYLKKMVNEVKSNPTFNNIHNFQSALGDEIGYWTKQPKSEEKTKALESLSPIRDEIKDKIYSFLDKKELNGSDKYKEFQRLYRENVIPYTSNKNIRNIVKGLETNPKNLHTEFEYPSDKRFINKEGIYKVKIGDVNKILEDLPLSSKDKILFSKIGIDHKDASSLLDKLEEARRNGYSSYFTPETMKNISDLKNRLKYIKGTKLVGEGLKWGAGGALTGSGFELGRNIFRKD